MSKNPFSPQNQGEMKLKRNQFDMSRRSVYTSEFGRLDPNFCLEVIPGDSITIDPTLAIQAMPTVFPVQTKVRVQQMFFYSRNRTVFDDFEDAVFNTRDVEFPFLELNNERAKSMIKTGSLGDFFGVPTTLGSTSDHSIPLSASFIGGFFKLNSDSFRQPVSFYVAHLTVGSDLMGYYDVAPSDTDNLPSCNCGLVLSSVFTGYDSVSSARFEVSSRPSAIFPVGSSPFIGVVLDEYDHVVFARQSYAVIVNNNYIQINFNGTSLDPTKKYKVGYLFVAASGPYNSYSQDLTVSSCLLSGVSTRVFDATEDTFISDNPFVGSNPKIKLNALPFRHYEQICNYYFRNDKNNPYMLGGEPQYNEFIPTHAGGADKNEYKFHYHNWELDMFTSAVQSPQFGEAPLVGITFNPDGATAKLNFVNVNGENTAGLDGNAEDGRPLEMTVGIDKDGKILDIADFSQDMPSANLRKVMEMINYGISINDLRVTNSFQRFLENTLRRGLRYRNQLKSHFGVSVDYPDIDIPQYIGGFSGVLDTGKITNVADSPNAGLGDYIGTLGGLFSGKKIRCYCPEHGFIVGIVSITPIPNYAQSIAPYMTKTNFIDYFLPEFGKIGYVPIYNSSVAPLQASAENKLDAVFGYQKAWYEYMQSLDEVHCDFRTTLKDFVLSRTFGSTPLLSEDFVRVKPDQLNDIFVTNNIADAYQSSAKFLCHANFNVYAARPIPRYGMPSLE